MTIYILLSMGDVEKKTPIVSEWAKWFAQVLNEKSTLTLQKRVERGNTRRWAGIWR